MPKERKKVLCMDAQRHAEYYGMQQTFDELYCPDSAGACGNHVASHDGDCGCHGRTESL